jgi:hypothetical protein
MESRDFPDDRAATVVKTFMASLLCVSPSVLLLTDEERLDWAFTAVVRLMDGLLSAGWDKLNSHNDLRCDDDEAQQRPLFGGVLSENHSDDAPADKSQRQLTLIKDIGSRLAPISLFIWSCWEIMFAWFYYPECLPPTVCLIDLPSYLIISQLTNNSMSIGYRKWLKWMDV